MSNVTNMIKRVEPERRNVISFLGIISMLVLVDIVVDFLGGMPLRELAFDIIIEGAILVMVGITVRYVWKKFAFEQTVRFLVEKDLVEVKESAKESEAKSRVLFSEFRKYIEENFDSWRLSKSEREIAILLLMGYQTKDIASKRYTSDKTIRNQCLSVYEKSQLANRNAFAAFFLRKFLIEIGDV